MKYRTVWKPGGHPRRGMGSMKVNRRKLQALNPRGSVSGKGVENFGSLEKKAA